MRAAKVVSTYTCPDCLASGVDGNRVLFASACEHNAHVAHRDRRLFVDGDGMVHTARMLYARYPRRLWSRSLHEALQGVPYVGVCQLDPQAVPIVVRCVDEREAYEVMSDGKPYDPKFSPHCFDGYEKFFIDPYIPCDGSW